MTTTTLPRPFLAQGWLRALAGTHVSRLVGIVIFGTIVAMCVLVPILSPYSPNDFVNMPFMAPSWAHPFGTDSVGRDIFVRTFAGGSVDLIAAAFATGFAVIVGTTLGTLAGATKHRWADTILMRLSADHFARCACGRRGLRQAVGFCAGRASCRAHRFDVRAMGRLRPSRPRSGSRVARC
jgi:peptide/nickel transport system permease protein